MKIKVGDKVRFRSDLKVGEYYGGCVWCKYDNCWIGKEVIVLDCDADSFQIEGNGGHGNILNCFTEEMLDQNYHSQKQEIHITTDGVTTYAVMKRGGEVVKCSKAVCNPEDEFDLLTGAKIAIERLEEKPKSKFIPYLSDDWEDCPYGIIGEPVPMTLAFGEPLYVGDVIECYNTDTKFHCKDFVVNVEGEPFVMGLQGFFFKNGIYGDWQIRRVKSYRELKNGERINTIVAVLQEE